MNDLLSRQDRRPSAPAHLPPLKRSSLHLLKTCFAALIGLVIVLAFGSGALLLFNDIPWPMIHPLAHAPISAVPLLLIGLASLGFQIVVRPKLLDLFKAFIVSAAFLLWGIDQLLPAGWGASMLGDVVIVLYVIDLGWMMADRLKQQGWHKQARRDAHCLPPLIRRVGGK